MRLNDDMKGEKAAVAAAVEALLLFLGSQLVMLNLLDERLLHRLVILMGVWVWDQLFHLLLSPDTGSCL